MVMYLSAAATMVALLLAIAMRLTHPVRAKISNADDLITWTITFLPFVTGMAVAGDPSGTILARDHVIYGGPLAVHFVVAGVVVAVVSVRAS